ncbi:MAG: hypothetical protein ACW98X_17860 [Promethearchaeota archaeon]|jgi:hypothetical protein
MKLTIEIPKDIWEKLYLFSKSQGKSEKELKKELENQFNAYFREIFPIVIENIDEGMPVEMVNIWQADEGLKLSTESWKKFYEK